MLTEYFSMCAKSEDAKKYLYPEFPEHYVWDNKFKCWNERKKRNVIGRVNGANPIEGERFYLRLLLNHVRGPTSFEDLLTVNHKKYSSFKEAAQRRGLLESDQSLTECLNEAISFQMPHELRRLFAIILVYCAPTDVKNLWDTYFDPMSEDFKREPGTTYMLQLVKTLKSLNYFLESMGKTIKSYDLPKIPVEFNNVQDDLPREIKDEISISIPEEDYEAENKLNPEQHKAFSRILHFVERGKSGIFFIDGPGGTGKTFLYRALLAHIRSKKRIAIATATSGVAAAIMPGGRTAHSRFKIPLDANASSSCSISKQSGAAELLRKAQLIIWDEAPMAKRWAIENVDKCLQDIMGNDKYFGGKVVVFGGDFRQVLPVVPRGTAHQTICASLVKSPLWGEMEKNSSKTNMRAKTDSKFSELLLRIGNGEEPTDTEGNVKIPEEMIIHYDNDEDSIHRLIMAIFPSLGENSHSAGYMTGRAILATRNEHVDKLNEKLISIFPGESREYHSYDEAIDDTNNFYDEEFLNSLTPNGLPPHKLLLKKNCPIILLRNLDPSNGLCNG
ncbi:PREDICTED: ATP-dependent DNA helicase PIF1-like [Erythranthe guttata]|uniref:ATP-dependent DNA helicase PIF1-like n=1 Tax=Erythranthe guttata TaxID=4155 RepID=UPI00064D8B13|nr:PREDICTED: ATP-dependent DNA helicase PIF1-like [Erythranthe guttata]|eukprot:XP_012856955.1 PREDICTED: ATP-dependent DNA helicase PIF1-like [Erythranthe guttata]